MSGCNVIANKNDIRAAAVVPAPASKSVPMTYTASPLERLYVAGSALRNFSVKLFSGSGIAICEVFPYVCLLRAKEAKLFSPQAEGLCA